GQLLTGLLYTDESMPIRKHRADPAERRLRDLGESELRFSRPELDAFMDEFAQRDDPAQPRLPRG
ncbi:MAG: hypothetical protein ABI838_01335, partial [Chloroflexota bacterium]